MEAVFPEWNHGLSKNQNKFYTIMPYQVSIKADFIPNEFFQA